MRIIFAAVACAFFSAYAAAADVYKDFADLKAHKAEGRDYKVTALDRRAPVTVFAIHGGIIEPGTAEAAVECAGKDWNLYMFEALGAGHSMEMHVTAAHFDDPLAVALATASVTAIALHGRRDENGGACIGGANAALRAAVAEALARAGFKKEEPCLRLPGATGRNIVNRTVAGGVQLEMSVDLATEMQNSPVRRLAFCSAIRGAVGKWLAVRSESPEYGALMPKISSASLRDMEAGPIPIRY